MDNFTEEQWNAVAELRELLKNDPLETYMTEDYYLAKWLATNSTNFNVQVALPLVRENLKWRTNENISTILEENWQEMRVRLPYSRNTFDKSGKPILYIDMGHWDIATFLTTDESHGDLLARYIIMFIEESEAHVRQLRAEGQNVTQFTMIVNVGGYSTMKHATMTCLYFYRDIANFLLLHFPKCEEKTVFLNVPYLFKMVYLFFTPTAQNFIEIFGQDQSQWESMLLEYIDKEQFPHGVLAELDQSKKDNSEGFMQWNKEL